MTQVQGPPKKFVEYRELTDDDRFIGYWLSDEGRYYSMIVEDNGVTSFIPTLTDEEFQDFI
ncbi:MAG: hypothetical protein ACTSUK_10875 [Promethearchaeota archaeon]